MTTRNAENWLAASALALESAAAAFLWGAPAGAAARAVAALVAHLAGAACAAMFLSRRAGRLVPAAGGRGARLLFGTASILLPVIGPAALAALLARVARRHDQPHATLARAPLSAVAGLVPLSSEAPAGIGRGSLEARLRFDPTPASRIAAVLATRRLPAPADAARLLKLALRDRHEDVRLLAHALLEDRDRQAFRGIDELERELAALAEQPAASAQQPAASAELDDRRGPVACLLAEALWELCASGLVSGELESFTLRRARALLEEARQSAPMQTSARAALLLAQVLLRQREAEGARAAVEESARLGAPPSLLAPLAAEAAFAARSAAPRGGSA